MEGDFIKINKWLLPLSWLYGIGVWLRNLLFDTGVIKSRTFDVPVISVNLGTGGGFPGIPLAIMLDTKVTLLDSIQKKVSAVDGFIHALGLDDRCSAKCSRSEDLARTAPESFDLVVSRAVAQLNVLIEYASPLLATDGMLCALKANLSDDELATASAAAEICGMTIESQESFNLPQDYGHREILFIRKTGASSIPLPRRNGMATKRPLGIR